MFRAADRSRDGRRYIPSISLVLCCGNSETGLPRGRDRGLNRILDNDNDNDNESNVGINAALVLGLGIIDTVRGPA